MKNKGLIIIIIILVICVLGLSGFIIYDKVLSNDVVSDEHVNDNNSDSNNIVDNEQTKEDEKTDNITSYNVVANSPNDFINKIADTEKVLENEVKYEVSFNDLKFIVHRIDSKLIRFDSIVITYKNETINKNGLNGLYDTLNSYYFDKDEGLFILTFLPPQSAIGETIIIAFDNNGKIYLDESVSGSVKVDNTDATLLNSYCKWTGEMCASSNMESTEIVCEKILYEYINDTLEVKNREITRVKDLPECDW